MNASRCPACEEPYLPDDRFCGGCGADLELAKGGAGQEGAEGMQGVGPGESVPSRPRTCGSCGAQLQPDWKFCQGCGERIAASDERGGAEPTARDPDDVGSLEAGSPSGGTDTMPVSGSTAGTGAATAEAPPPEGIAGLSRDATWRVAVPAAMLSSLVLAWLLDVNDMNLLAGWAWFGLPLVLAVVAYLRPPRIGLAVGLILLAQAIAFVWASTIHGLPDEDEEFLLLILLSLIAAVIVAAATHFGARRR